MTLSEENYLKAIYHLSAASPDGVTTNSIAEKMETKASSVTDMLKKLAVKKLITHRKYQGVLLTDQGRKAAKMIVRKHRLWEVFLVEKLHFTWDEVHDIAEQLEHIKSEKLVDRLDEFLGFPTHDPHGDPIPNASGEIKKVEKYLLADLAPEQKGICAGVKDTSADFLKYLNRNGIGLGSEITILAREDFDKSLRVSVDGAELQLSQKISENIFVTL